MKTIVVAYDKNRGIGAANDLLWQRDLPDDLKRFKEVTMGGAIIMGHKTFESIGRPLPGRQNIILSRDGSLLVDGATITTSLESAYKMVEPGREAFVIGGGQIYTLAMDTVDRIFATEVDASFPEADVFFPAVDAAVWQEKDRVHHTADARNRYGFDFVTYVRRQTA
ncbi:dihydrofolate reductase [Streptomyces caniscabiei]|uniref:dihydrofolate reductase n=1 Tax=Streptomyces caniscabiei TaxID=2746961 RepID=UPI0029AB10E4|nr:dihydrofolate reductase [Streptomyces caniscabiei]MDX2776010.1 dihydrofolate reductase [Streptomyces caniscabiei]